MTILDFSSRVGHTLDAPAEQAVSVPGYLVGRPLNSGTTTQALLARDHTGEGCVVLLRPDAPEPRRRAEIAQHLRHPNLMPVREVTTAGDGRLAVVVPRLGPSLREVLDRTPTEGPLSAGEVAGVLDGLGHALGYWHENVGPHGDVRAENVLVGEDGRVVLIDLVEDVATLQRPASTAADLTDLASLMLECTSPEVMPDLTRALAPILQAGAENSRGAGASPLPEVTARSLAAGAAMIALPETLAAHRLPDQPVDKLPVAARRPAPTPRASGKRRTFRVLAGFGGIGLLLGVGVGLFLWTDGDFFWNPGHDAVERTQIRAGDAEGTAADEELAQSGADQEPGRASDAAPNNPGADGAPTAGEEMKVGVATLLAARDAALRDQDALALAELSVPGSPAAAQDAAALQSLVDAGEKLVEHTTTITDASVESRAGEEATVRATVQQQESLRSGPAGFRTIPAQPPHCVLLDLRTGPQGLLLYQVRACE